MKPLKRIGLLLFILLPLIISSCHKDKDRVGAPIGIGSEGGIVRSADGVASVNIPPGSTFRNNKHYR